MLPLNHLVLNHIDKFNKYII